MILKSDRSPRTTNNCCATLAWYRDTVVLVAGETLDKSRGIDRYDELLEIGSDWTTSTV